MDNEAKQKELYIVLARLIAQIENCKRSNNEEWLHKSIARVDKLIDNHMPSGSGIDNGTRIDKDKSTENKLVFYAPFHHMNENGFYDGWTDHTITVTASLTSEIDLKISGRDRNEIKDYLHDIYHHALTSLVDEFERKEEPMNTTE